MPDEFARLNRALDDFRASRQSLVCEDCDEASTYLTIDNEVATYCQECAHAPSSSSD